MTLEKAKDVLLNYTCCCKYGTSPINCSDEECDFGKAIKTLCNRPKGEWVAIEPYTHKTFCPFCKEDTRFEVGKYDNFCPNCGADMRGEEE